MKLLEAEALARKLFIEHGLNWRFRFDSALRRFGACRFKSETISLSRSLTQLNDESRVKDTLLHEIAHALVGRGKGHGYTWRLKAQEIGCSAKRCYLESSLSVAPTKWLGTCPSGHEFSRDRRSRSNSSCNRCSPGGRFNENYLITWKLR